ncbi:MAG: glycosyltransferase family 4 protein [Syntrophaceae bacterium]|nr:glycosyltransferase family 4 protein [Syntrophaceae bacterium]
MKVLLVHKFFHVTGGAEVFFFETGRVLEKYGCEVAYFSTINERNRPSSYTKYFTHAPDFQSGNLLKRVRAIFRIVYSYEAKEKFTELLNDFRPDIVHIFAMFTHISPSILDACREVGVPVVISCNDYKHICPNYKLFHHGHLCEDCKGGRFYNTVRNKCCQNSLVYSVASCIESTSHHALNILRKNVHTFFFASEFMARKTEEFWGKDSFRWAKLLNPFDSTKYPLCKEYDDYFLFFGRFVEEKGADVLLQAMRQIPEPKLVLVGDGPQIEQLKGLAAQLGLENVEFIGPQWGEALDQILMRARFVVMPSVWHENFPYVIVQAFAMGKAVIGTDRGGIPELIKDKENGFVYPAHDPDTLAKRIEKLWLNPELAVEMGTKAKAYADDQFNDQKFYETLISNYESIVK